MDLEEMSGNEGNEKSMPVYLKYPLIAGGVYFVISAGYEFVESFARIADNLIK